MLQGTTTIAGKECRVYLTTWMSYVVFAAFVLITAFFFYVFVSRYQALSFQYAQQGARAALNQMNVMDMVLRPLYSNVAVFFSFMVPILTMRLLAEERRSKTLELLLTTRTHPAAIVLGKFLAGAGQMLIMLGLTIVFPILLHFVGIEGQPSPVDWGTVALIYGGMALMGAAFVSVGLLTSALTESQLVAVMLSFGLLIMMWAIGAAALGQEGFWKEVLEYVAIVTHMQGFLRGLLSSVDVVYFVTLTCGALLLSYRAVEAERWR